MENRILNQILEYMVSLDGEFKYESNGSFGSENGAKTKKLWSKQVRESNRVSDTWYCSNHCSNRVAHESDKFPCESDILSL